MLTESFLETVGNIIVGPFKKNKDIELIMIMIVFPMICNACQFWIVDNILKLSAENSQEIIEIPLDDIDKNDPRKFSNIYDQPSNKEENLHDITSDDIVDIDDQSKNKQQSINKV